MGMMSFFVPAGLAPDAAKELERACVAGGPDNMPWPTEVRLEPGLLTVRREVEDSGTLAVPWEIEGFGRLMGATGTLIERPGPYTLQVELARGKVHQLRCLAADWQAGGLQLTPALDQHIRDSGLSFGRGVTESTPEEAGSRAQGTLVLAYQAARELVQLYIEQMFQARHQRQPRLDTTLGCRLQAAPLPPDAAAELARTCNRVCLPFSWSEVEPTEASYHWEAYDAILEWAEDHDVEAVAGPLIDFSQPCLPDWLWLWERDLSSIASFMCDYVETTINRYRGRVRSWQLTAASNCGTVLALGEDELMWLTARLVEAARQVDSRLEIIIGIAQPWGEYMSLEDRTHSPFIFADTLIRSGLNFGALDLEVVMGVSPRGSYCRDLMEASRLLDLYSLLGMPLRVTLGFPSAGGPDPRAHADLKAGAGHWGSGFSPAMQEEWAPALVALALCKPTVRAVQWAHLTDAEAHQFPHCGLIDHAGQPKPALRRLRELREAHLH